MPGLPRWARPPGPARRPGRDDAAGSRPAGQPLAEPPVHPADREGGQDGAAGRDADDELLLWILRRVLLGVAAFADARPFGVDGWRARAAGRLHLLLEPVPVLNGRPRRGRVDGSRG